MLPPFVVRLVTRNQKYSLSVDEVSLVNLVEGEQCLPIPDNRGSQFATPDTASYQKSYLSIYAHATFSEW